MSDYPKEVVEGALQTATKRNMELYAEVERLRAALEEIARYDCGAAHDWCRNKAREALTVNEQTAVKEEK